MNIQNDESSATDTNVVGAGWTATRISRPLPISSPRSWTICSITTGRSFSSTPQVNCSQSTGPPLHDIITKHIAAVRVVNRDGVWRKEFFSYAIAPKPRFGPPTVANPHADKDTGARARPGGARPAFQA